MDPIQTLMDEHRKIEAGLDALDGWATRLQEGGEAPLEDLGGFVRFIREYADRAHHGKEEDILFEVMVREGFPREGGPIAVMLMEHDEGRGYVKVLADAVDAGEALEGHTRGPVISAARSFSHLLRAHIQKEDQILYPMGKTQLSPAAYEEIGARSRAFEEEHAGELRELVALGASLVEKYG